MGDVITAEDVLEWHGSHHNIEELAEYVADLLNRKITIDDGRDVILDYVCI